MMNRKIKTVSLFLALFLLGVILGIFIGLPVRKNTAHLKDYTVAVTLLDTLHCHAEAYCDSPEGELPIKRQMEAIVSQTEMLKRNIRRYLNGRPVRTSEIDNAINELLIFYMKVQYKHENKVPQINPQLIDDWYNRK